MAIAISTWTGCVPQAVWPRDGGGRRGPSRPAAPAAFGESIFGKMIKGARCRAAGLLQEKE